MQNDVIPPIIEPRPVLHHPKEVSSKSPEEVLLLEAIKNATKETLEEAEKEAPKHTAPEIPKEVSVDVTVKVTNDAPKEDIMGAPTHAPTVTITEVVEDNSPKETTKEVDPYEGMSARERWRMAKKNRDRENLKKNRKNKNKNVPSKPVVPVVVVKRPVASEKLPYEGLPEFIVALPECTRGCFEEYVNSTLSNRCARLDNWNCVCYFYTKGIYNETEADEANHDFFECIDDNCGVWKWGSERVNYYQKVMALKEHCDEVENVYDVKRNKKEFKEAEEAKIRRKEWEAEKARKKSGASRNNSAGLLILGVIVIFIVFA
ncbi:hypothetical protein BJ508DRAFT_410020 [Ascobolus immersus RN42]|uniref:Uncharacterized protein n=1 Tax=Ascobolus immersus RN42 TaxID=1160509 RepID=A0A3N4IQC5_ASCIM|nr:hypothetical protein BJ508DRAFT_410020 [Ascobolus immersus RN42]